MVLPVRNSLTGLVLFAQAARRRVWSCLLDNVLLPHRLGALLHYTRSLWSSLWAHFMARGQRYEKGTG